MNFVKFLVTCTVHLENALMKIVNFFSVCRILLFHHFSQHTETRWFLKELLLSKQYKPQTLKNIRLCKEELGKRSMCDFSQSN